MDDCLSGLRTEARKFRGAALAETTKRAYKSQLNAYLKFCFNFSLIPAPATQETLNLYTAFLARTLSPSSIPAYLNVVRLLHLESGFANPIAGNWELMTMQKGIARLLGKPPRQKLPITVHILLDLHRTLTNSHIDLAFWAACLIAFLGFFRKASLIPSADMLSAKKFIARSDVKHLTLSAFSVDVRHSKTNQFGLKVLNLPFVACPDARLCPVRALIAHLGSSCLPQDRPLFNFVENTKEVVFTHAIFVKKLKTLLKVTGHPSSEISSHSFRRGGATLAYSVGLSTTEIKLRGDWRSNAYERYLCVSPESVLASARALSYGLLKQA